MNIKTEILREMDAGKTPEILKKRFSSATVFKYRRLHYLIQANRKIRDLIDTDGWERLSLPALKQILKAIEKW